MKNISTLTTDTDTTIPADTDNETTTSRPQVRYKQSLRSAERVAQLEKLLNTLTANEEMAALLASKGYNAERLAEGAILREAALQGFVTRQQALGALRDAYAASNAALQTVRAEYLDFRFAARALFKTFADRTRLDLTAPVPADATALLSLVRVVYHTSQDTPSLASELAKYGYAPQRMTELLAHTNAAAEALYGVHVARSRAQQATVQRELAVQELHKWTTRLLMAARLVSRKRPDLKALLA